MNVADIRIKGSHVNWGHIELSPPCVICNGSVPRLICEDKVFASLDAFFVVKGL